MRKPRGWQDVHEYPDEPVCTVGERAAQDWWREERDCIQARVIEDSVTDEGIRLTTVEATLHRFCLAELNTHRTFSRNSESSRAVPLRKRLEKVRTSPAVPISFPTEQPGMQGGVEVDDLSRDSAESRWRRAAYEATLTAEGMADDGVHKSIANRLLEPFLWHTVVITATEWVGFFRQRCHEAAQPEIRAVAECIRGAMGESVPTPLTTGEWHTPFVEVDELEALSWVSDPYRKPTENDVTLAMTDPEEERYPGEELIMLAWDRGISVWGALKQLSAARCARASYVLNGEWDMRKDFARFDKLTTEQMESGNPVHWSPLEHVATPTPLGPAPEFEAGVYPGNFRGWFQFRHELDVSPYAGRVEGREVEFEGKTHRVR